MGLFQWMFSSQQLSVDSQAVAPPVNESCVMELSQYYFGPMTTIQYNVTCGTCKRCLRLLLLDISYKLLFGVDS